MMNKLALGVLIAMLTCQATLAQQTMTATGQVVSVRLIPRTFSVRDAQAQEVIRYRVPAGTSVTVAGGMSRLGHLRAGDQVNVTYRNTDDGREATRIRVPQATPSLDQRVTDGLFSTVRGEVAAVDFRTRTLTVVGDQTGERFSYAIPQATNITIEGESARLGHLRRGDSVTLRFRAEEQERQVVRVLVPQTTVPLAERPNQAPAGVAAQAQQQLPAQLPTTAGPLPLLPLFGLLALLGAGWMRSRRIRHSR